MKPIIIRGVGDSKEQSDERIVIIGEDGTEASMRPGQMCGGLFVGDDERLELDVRLVLDAHNQKYQEFYRELQGLLKKYRESHVVKYISGM